MKKLVLAGLAMALLLVPALTGQKKKPGAVSRTTIARGQYLVDSVGLCGDCHTPRNQKGEFIKEQYLKGTVLDFKPAAPVPVWADTSPNIAGLPGWEKDAAIKFLMTGIVSNGLPPRPPMPQYRFNQQDATAIVAYLQSLNPKE
jgi:mono/diheme cytochrome c family protein